MTTSQRQAGRARKHTRSRTPQATPRNHAGPLLRALLATVGIGVLFLLVAAPVFVSLGRGAAQAQGGPTSIVAAPNEPTFTPGPTATPVPRAPQGDLGPPLIAIVAGHSGTSPWGVPDPGAVCEDGLTEVEITKSVAALVVDEMRGRGYPAEMLGEYDTRLSGLRATLFLSIHVDSCEYINEEATGFKVAGPEAPRGVPELHARLLACLDGRYQAVTGLGLHEHSISPDMVDYHAFNEIDPRTPAAIIELGFLNLDRKILTEGQDRIVKGIVDGLVCYLQTP